MNQITISQIVGAVARNKYKCFFVFMSVILMTLAAFLVLPRQYGSEGRLFVQLGRNNSALDPTPGSSPVSIQDTRETEINSVSEIIKSRAVLEAVVDQIGADEILKNPLTDFVGSLLPALPKRSGGADGGFSEEEFERLKKRNAAAKKLEDDMVVDVGKKTSVISVFCRSASARMAQNIVDAIMRTSQAKHLEVHSVKGSAQFFDEQFDRQESTLNDALAQQANFRKRLGILSIDGARNTVQAIVDRLENDRISAETELAQAEKSLERYNEQLAKISDTIDVPTSGVERQSFEDSRTELYKLEAERARLQARLKKGHPNLTAIEDAIVTARESLTSMVTDRTQSAKQINPVYEKVKVNYIVASVSRDAAASRLEKVQQEINDANQELEKLNNSQVEAEQLARDVSIAREYLQNYSTKRGESRVLDELDKQRISDVVIAQPANLVVKHTSPRGSFLFPIGFIAACFLALCTALFAERNKLNASLGEEEVEQVIDMPVLVTLPRVYSSRNMVN